ncbi:MAG: HAD family hydrolase [Planctomycetota bacterium]|jgi:HAD superfamily hydrolase (TIGR01549 family)
MVSAIIFDAYGTLLQLTSDSKPYLKLVQGAPEADRKRWIDCALTHDLPTLTDFCRRAGLADPEDLPELQAQLDRDLGAAAVYADTLPTLRALSDLNIPVGVISNLATPYKRPFLSNSLDALVQACVFSCDCGLRKPDARIYRLALERLRVPTESAVMVGDSMRSDVRGPAAVGFRGIHLDREGTTGAPGSIRSLAEVVKIATEGAA